MTTDTDQAPLESPSTYFRSTVSRGIPADAVDPDGGDFGAGLIKRTAVISRGEALGHGLWIDTDFLSDVAWQINAAGSAGIKARFTHPDASGDGLGSSLGRIKDARVEDGKVLADLHLSEAAHKSPDGDLADYVMALATDTPEQFGQSIAFLRDVDAETNFTEDHTDGPDFTSPDPDNTGNLYHARLHTLHAVDAVDTPAANPDGLFHRGRRGVALEAEQFMDYALGLSAEPPALTAFSIDPDRVRSFFTRYATRRGLQINTPPNTEDTMSEQQTQDVADVDTALETTTTTTEDTHTEQTATLADFTAQLARYTARFGAENGAEWFSAGMDWSDALDTYAGELEKQLATQTAAVAELREALQAERAGEDPVDLGPPAAKPDPGHGTLRIRVNGHSDN